MHVTQNKLHKVKSDRTDKSTIIAGKFKITLSVIDGIGS